MQHCRRNKVTSTNVNAASVAVSSAVSPGAHKALGHTRCIHLRSEARTQNALQRAPYQRPQRHKYSRAPILSDPRRHRNYPRLFSHRQLLQQRVNAPVKFMTTELLDRGAMLENAVRGEIIRTVTLRGRDAV